jgi:HlyD family secretion protein
MKKVLIGIAVIAVIALLVLLNIYKSADADAGISYGISSRKATLVKAATIGTGDIYSYVTAHGRVEEINKAQVFFDTPLRVLKVFVSKNDYVEQGERLVELDTSTLSDEMNRLKIQKEIQSITLKKLESGQSLLSLESSLNSSRNALERAQDSYQAALDEYEKQEKLYIAGIIPKTQLDQYEKMVKDAKAAVDSAQLSFESAEKNYQTSVGSHNLDIQAQVKNIELLSSQISDIERKLKKIKSFEKSPISGYVTDILITEGGYTMSGQPAFTIIDISNLKITATVNEYNTKDLSTGQKVKITGEALGDGVELEGEIVSVAPFAKAVQSTSGIETVVEVIIKPLDGEGVLKPGLNVECDIITQEKKNVVVTEFNIYMEDKDRRQSVMLIDPESMTVKKQYVTLGIYSDMTVEVLDGLKEGDMVVIDPQPSLSDGEKIRIAE